MRFRTLFALLLALVAFLPAVCRPAAAQTGGQTPTEARAIAIAEQDHTAYTLPPDKLVTATDLHHRRMAIFLINAIWGILQIWLLLELGIIARMRNVATNLSKNRWAQGFTFFLEFLLITTLLALPVDLYEHHVQLAYGLSVQHWGSWFGDQAKGFALAYLFGGLGVMILYWLIRKSPRRWWLWLSFVAMAFAVIGTFASPYIIDPLFNRFEPLTQTNPALVAQLQQVVARGKGINIPPERMFLMHASDKVTTLNAYVTGFGASKRVVVWDTSIAKGTTDEILFIFGHEMGHYVLGHIVSGMVFYFALILVSFFLGFHLFQWLLRRYDERWRIHGQANWASLAVFVFVLSLLGTLSEPIGNTFSRTHEHAADVYGQEIVHGIVRDPQASAQAAFQLLGENGLSYPTPSPLYEFWTGSHPPIWFRAAFARAYNPWAPNETPRYFPK